MWPVVLSLLVVAASGRAQTPEARPVAAIAPFVDDQAMLVARVDLDRIAPEEITNWLISLGFPAKETPSETAMALQPLNALKGAGARELYAIFSPAYLPQTPVVIVVPLTAQADAAAIAAALKGMPGGAAEQVRGAVCAGAKISLERLRAMTPVRQPLLEQAFERAGDGALQVAISLTADQRRAIEETLPELPAEIGGGPSKVLTRGMFWVAVSADLPPHPAVRAVAQCQDQQAAEKVRALIRGTLENMGQSEYVRQAVPNYNQLIPTLTPRVVGDTLTLSLQAGDIDAYVKELVAGGLKAADEATQGRQSQKNLHMIFLACAMYTKDHNDEWPDELKQLPDRGYLPSAAELQNPMRPGLEIGYVYRKPAKNAPAGTVVLYDQHDGWPALGVAVGFCDGAVELVQDQERFRQLLEKGR
jgi:hypothetical protein